MAAASLLCAAVASPASPERVTMPEMFPPRVMELDEVMSDWFAPTLRQMGEKPLWVAGGVRGAGTVYRFTFIGNMCKSTSIRIDEEANRITLRVIGLDRCKNKLSKLHRSNRRIAPTDWAEAKALMDDADLWKFEIGDWDGEEGREWVDCTFLAMERGSAGDYRIARSQISCIKPPKLMAVVNKVAKLAGRSRLSLGYLDTSLGDTMR